MLPIKASPLSLSKPQDPEVRARTLIAQRVQARPVGPLAPNQPLFTAQEAALLGKVRDPEQRAQIVLGAMLKARPQAARGANVPLFDAQEAALLNQIKDPAVRDQFVAAAQQLRPPTVGWTPYRPTETPVLPALVGSAFAG